MSEPTDRPRTLDPRLVLLGSVLALLAGIGAMVVVVLLAEKVL